jgi:hypothetical protein
LVLAAAVGLVVAFALFLRKKRAARARAARAAARA